jgi:hypothetical protein
MCWSQWLHSLRCRFTAARLLRSWVRIPPGTWMFVCCVCCQVEVSAMSWTLVQRSPTNCGALSCVIKKPCERGGHSLRWAAEPEKIIINIVQWIQFNVGDVTVQILTAIDYSETLLLTFVSLDANERSKTLSPTATIISYTLMHIPRFEMCYILCLFT